ncbi:MAG: methionyl-tRNA formyltransferase [Saprospiraceae bacterium]
MRIVFMGTPDFAVPSLDILMKNGYDIVGVVTAADKMGGRGGKEKIESAVKKYALTYGLKVLQPEKLRDPEFIVQLKSLKADLQVVVAFRMLPEMVWNMPPLGTINLHGSLLPAYRGAAPIHWAVINGEKETGVTTFFLTHEIDTGDILMSSKLSIGENDTTGDIHDRMMVLGAQTILESLWKIQNGDYRLIPQDDSKASKAPKLSFEICEIDFSKTSREVHNFVRGMSPFPAAWTRLNGETLKIFKTTVVEQNSEEKAGTFLKKGKDALWISCADSYVSVEDVQLQGKKRMLVRDFLNGYNHTI